MQCSKCSNSIFEGQEVCLKCGHILGYESQESKPCRHCSREIPIEYKKCPYCKKKQRSKRKVLVNILLPFTFFITAMMLMVLYSPSKPLLEKEYKESCIQVEYETLVRQFSKYDEGSFALQGKIESVDKIKFGNHISIIISLENNENYLVEVHYNNNLKKGFIKDDEIIVYGKYKDLRGNIPLIRAKYIEFISTPK